MLAMLDTDAHPEMTDKLQIKSLPTVFGVVGGRLNDQFVGGQSAEFIEQFVAKLAAQGTPRATARRRDLKILRPVFARATRREAARDKA